MKIGLGLDDDGARSRAALLPLAVSTRGYSLGMISDPHIGGAIARPALVRACLDWITAETEGLVGIMVCGDMLEAPFMEPRFSVWARDPDGGNLDSSIRIIPVPGNWDAEIMPGIYGETPASPHATLLATYPTLFKGKEWYSLDHEALRILVVNDLSDYLADAGYACYANCNPPGSQYEANPDHSGITIPGSPQRYWLDQKSASHHLWKIAGMHRSLWAPFDSDPRKLNRLARPAMATAIDNGLSLILQGDIHVGSFSGPWYPTAPDYEDYRLPGTVGAYSLTLAGGFLAREVEEEVLPNYEDTLHWASGSTVGLCHGAILAFEGDVAYLQVFECSDADPTGRVAFTHTLIRNPGGGS